MDEFGLDKRWKTLQKGIDEKLIKGASFNALLRLHNATWNTSPYRISGKKQCKGLFGKLIFKCWKILDKIHRLIIKNSSELQQKRIQIDTQKSRGLFDEQKIYLVCLQIFWTKSIPLLYLMCSDFWTQCIFSRWFWPCSGLWPVELHFFGQMRWKIQTFKQAF